MVGNAHGGDLRTDGIALPVLHIANCDLVAERNFSFLSGGRIDLRAVDPDLEGVIAIEGQAVGVEVIEVDGADFLVEGIGLEGLGLEAAIRLLDGQAQHERAGAAVQHSQHEVPDAHDVPAAAAPAEDYVHAEGGFQDVLVALEDQLGTSLALAAGEDPASRLITGAHLLRSGKFPLALEVSGRVLAGGVRHFLAREIRGLELVEGDRIGVDFQAGWWRGGLKEPGRERQGRQRR